MLTVSEFLQQIPVGLILNVCISASLLFAAFIYFYNRSRKRKKLKEQEEAAARGVPVYTLSQPTPYRSVDTGELPPLDLLLNDVRHEPPVRSVPPGTYTVHLQNGDSTEAQEVLAILRDSTDGHLIVQMGDNAYRTLANAPDAKQEFSKLMRELAEVITKPDSAKPTAPKPPPAPKPSEDEPARLRDLMTEAPPEPVKPRSAPPPPIAPSGALPGDLPNFKLDNNPMKPIKGGGMFGKRRFEAPPVPELNIAGAIEAYLQHKLSNTPEYAGRQIHVRSAPGGGVRIEVDDKFYEAVGDVAETDVREFLSATIQEWQDRQ